MPPYLIRGINQPLFARWEDGIQPLPPDRHGIELEIVEASTAPAPADALTSILTPTATHPET